MPRDLLAPAAPAATRQPRDLFAPEMSTTEDVVRSAGSGGRNVVESTLGMGGDT